MKVFENHTIVSLLKEYQKVWALGYASSVLGWDKNTYMPPKGAEARGAAVGELRALKRFYMLQLRHLVEKAEKEELNDFERGVVRVLKRDLHYFESVPESLIKKEAKVTAEGYVTWVQAKRRSDFRLFAPKLKEIFEVEKEIAEHLGYDNHPYDALLDLYEEGLTVKKCEDLFSIVPKLSKLYKEVVGEEHPLAEEKYDRDAMYALNKYVVHILGFDFSRGRMDVSPHPFTDGIDINDVRITTWYHEKDFRRSLGAAVHEFGHALYDLQIDPALARTPIGEGVSTGVHESQSRFWENIVWRSRTFVEYFWNAISTFLPFVEDYGKEEVYKYFTVVRREPIRVEADEVQYVLHVFLRYKIEKELLEGSLEVSEVPNRWNELFESLFGYLPPDDAHGCLQDVHWSEGYIGYFPTYAIGSILAVQIRNAMEKDTGAPEQLVENGNFGIIRKWLKEKIHRWGATYPPEELVKRATGEPINPEYFVDYLRRKYCNR